MVKTLALVLACVVSLGLLAACSSEDKSAVDGTPENQAAANEKREEFKREAQERLDEVDREISEAKAKLESESADERAALQRRIDELEDRRGELADKIDDLNTDVDWEKVKDDIDRSMNDLKDDVKGLLGN